MPKQIEAPEKTTAEESPSCWRSPPNCIIIIAKFWERAKSYEHFIKVDRLLEHPKELQNFEKKMMTVFVVDKRARKKMSLLERHSDSITDVHGSQTLQSYKRYRFTQVQRTATHSQK